MKLKLSIVFVFILFPLTGIAGQDLPDVLSAATIRSYENRPVSERDLNMILKAGMNAPSARASRLWEYIVIRDREMLEKINTMFPLIPTREADLAIVVCANHKKEKSRPLTWLLDVGFAAQSLRLQAEQLGIASVSCRIYPENDGRAAKFRKLLNIPSDVTPTIIVPFGYPASKGKAQIWDPTIVHREKY